jgi:hypothetical protein
MRKDEASLFHENEILFYFQQEDTNWEIFLEENQEDSQQTAKGKQEDQEEFNEQSICCSECVEDESQSFIKKSQRRHSSVLHIFEKMCDNEMGMTTIKILNLEIPMKISNASSVFHQKDKLDIEIE